jgi:hypothetical protein
MSAALQRRRWLIIGGFNVYPNLYRHPGYETEWR